MFLSSHYAFLTWRHENIGLKLILYSVFFVALRCHFLRISGYFQMAFQSTIFPSCMAPGGASISLASDEEGYSLHQGNGGAFTFFWFGFGSWGINLTSEIFVWIGFSKKQQRIQKYYIYI